MGFILLIAIICGSGFLTYKAMTGGFDGLLSGFKKRGNQASQPQQAPASSRRQQPSRASRYAATARQSTNATQQSSRLQQTRKGNSKYNLPSAY